MQGGFPQLTSNDVVAIAIGDISRRGEGGLLLIGVIATAARAARWHGAIAGIGIGTGGDHDAAVAGACTSTAFTPFATTTVALTARWRHHATARFVGLGHRPLTLSQDNPVEDCITGFQLAIEDSTPFGGSHGPGAGLAYVGERIVGITAIARSTTGSLCATGSTCSAITARVLSATLAARTSGRPGGLTSPVGTFLAGSSGLTGAVLVSGAR